MDHTHLADVDWERLIAQRSRRFAASYPHIPGPKAHEYRLAIIFFDLLAQPTSQRFFTITLGFPRNVRDGQRNCLQLSKHLPAVLENYQRSPCPSQQYKDSRRANVQARRNPHRVRAIGKSHRASPQKKKMSSNYLDYPSNIAPGFDTMINPKDAADLCPRLRTNYQHKLDVDPLEDELHESERIIAEKLSMDVVRFLCVKRQLFKGFLEHLKRRDCSWNKTAAQKCSNIDVLKVSQVFMFYNRVGWFNEDLYTERLRAECYGD